MSKVIDAVETYNKIGEILEDLLVNADERIRVEGSSLRLDDDATKTTYGKHTYLDYIDVRDDTLHVNFRGYMSSTADTEYATFVIDVKDVEQLLKESKGWVVESDEDEVTNS